MDQLATIHNLPADDKSGYKFIDFTMPKFIADMLQDSLNDQFVEVFTDIFNANSLNISDYQVLGFEKKMLDSNNVFHGRIWYSHK